MTDVIWHRHHIVPKHMGGTDHPDNLVELTPMEHADAHSLLYALHKYPEDKLAELTLLERIESPYAEEIQRIRAKLGYRAMRKKYSDDEFRKLQGTRNAKTYVVEDPDGNRHTVTSLRAFCKKNGIHQGSLQGRGYSKGWRFICKVS